MQELLKYVMENPWLALANIIAGVGLCVWIERIITRKVRSKAGRQ